MVAESQIEGSEPVAAGRMARNLGGGVGVGLGTGPLRSPCVEAGATLFEAALVGGPGSILCELQPATSAAAMRTRRRCVPKET